MQILIYSTFFFPSCKKKKRNTVLLWSNHEERLGVIILNSGGVSLVSGLRWTHQRSAAVEAGHLRPRVGTVSWDATSVSSLSTLPSSSPTDTDLVLFLFWGLPFIIGSPKQMFGTERLPREDLLKVGLCCRSHSGSLPCEGRCLFLKHDSSGKLVTVILSCQLRSYYSLIESVPRCWWVEINLSIIVKGLWQKWGAQLVLHQFSLLNLLAKYPVWPQQPRFIESKEGESFLGKSGRH